MIAALFVCFVLATSIASPSKDTSRAVKTNEVLMQGVESPREDSQASTYQDIQDDERIVKTGKVRYKVENVKETIKEILEVTDKHKGQTEDSLMHEVDGQKEYQLTICVESNYFNWFLDDLEQIQGISYKESTTENVTEQFVDLLARLEVLEAQEKRFVEMLDKAENVDEMLRVERELGRIRLEIESKQGRLNYLKDITDYSYVHILVEEKGLGATIGSSEDVWEELQFSFTQGWEYFFAVTFSVMSSIIWASPFLIVIFLVLIMTFRKNKKRKTKS